VREKRVIACLWEKRAVRYREKAHLDNSRRKIRVKMTDYCTAEVRSLHTQKQEQKAIHGGDPFILPRRVEAFTVGESGARETSTISLLDAEARLRVRWEPLEVQGPHTMQRGESAITTKGY